MTDEPNTTPTIESLTEELRQLRTTETALRAFVVLLRAALLTVGGREIVLHDAELKGNFGKQVRLDREGEYFVLRFEDENPTTIEPLDHE